MSNSSKCGTSKPTFPPSSTKRPATEPFEPISSPLSSIHSGDEYTDGFLAHVGKSGPGAEELRVCGPGVGAGLTAMDLTLADPMDPALLVLVERALIVQDYQDPTHWGGRMVCSSY